QTVQYRLVLFRQFTNQVGKMHELGIHPAHAGDLLLQSRKQLVASEIGKDWGATQNMHVGFGLGDSGKWKRRRIGYPMRRVRAIGQRPAATSRAPSPASDNRALLPGGGFTYTGRMSKRRLHHAAVPVLALLCSVLLAACEQPSRLEQLREEGTLRVVTRNTPTTYYQGRHGDTGLEYELSKRFADRLELDLTMITSPTLEDIYNQLAQDKGPHLAAAGLTANPARADQIQFAEPYLQVTPQVVYRRGNRQPRGIEDLYDRRIMVLRGSSLADQLRELQTEHPQLAFEESDNLEVVDLLRMVNDGELDFAVVYSNELIVNQAFYPAVHVGFDLGPTQPMAWALPGGEDDSLLLEVNKFFDSIRADGTLDQLLERFYGHADVLDYVGARAFARHMQQRLPRFEKMFRQAGDQQGLDWRLLAAMAYQESLWDVDARSPTGVRGLMMLTLPTAKF